MGKKFLNGDAGGSKIMDTERMAQTQSQGLGLSTSGMDMR